MAETVAGAGRKLTEEDDEASVPAKAPSPRPRPRPEPSLEAPEPSPEEPEVSTEEPEASPEEPEALPVDDEPAEEKTTPAPSRKRMILLGALALAAVALLATGSTLAVAVLGMTNENSARAAALAAARQQVVNLITIDQKTLDADFNRLLDGATGEFKRDFAGQRTLFVEMVTTDQVRSTGEIKSAGMESFTGSKATVLVAAHASVQNAKVPQGEARDYRLRVSLEYIDDRWLVSQMEFVP